MTTRQVPQRRLQLTLGIDTLDDHHTRPLLVVPNIQQVAPQTLILGSRAALNSVSEVVRNDDLGLLGGERRGRGRVGGRRVQVDLGLLRERKRCEEQKRQSCHVSFKGHTVSCRQSHLLIVAAETEGDDAAMTTEWLMTRSHRRIRSDRVS